MITVLVNENNPISQDFYDSVINSLQIHRIFCSCGHAGCLHIHGYYTRRVKTPAGTVILRILRLKCAECGHTHAVLLSSLVPYSQIALKDQRQIVSAYEEKSNRNAVCDTNSSMSEKLRNGNSNTNTCNRVFDEIHQICYIHGQPSLLIVRRVT